ncbi:MAG: prolipoprotein diacylglyceryl transferase [Clostridia bacterium]|nr:prolipoprotein diacylglyceryl transferase [Clostridia bacterium]
MYDFFNTLSAIISLFYVLIVQKKEKSNCGILTENVNLFINRNGLLKKIKDRAVYGILLFFQYMIIAASIIVPVKNLNTWFGNIVTEGALNYFGTLFFIPFFVSIAAVAVGINPIECMDMLSAVYPFSLIPIKIACFCAGCCNGMEWEHGLYYVSEDKVMFPSQLVETALALLIFLFLLFYRKKAKKGTVYPVFVICYSATRFASEFFRIEPDVFFFLKTYHILCIIGVALGIAEYLLAVKYIDRIEMMFDKWDTVYDGFLKKYFSGEKSQMNRKKKLNKLVTLIRKKYRELYRKK